jgi:hypothetical protein
VTKGVFCVVGEGRRVCGDGEGFAKDVLAATIVRHEMRVWRGGDVALVDEIVLNKGEWGATVELGFRRSEMVGREVLNAGSERVSGMGELPLGPVDTRRSARAKVGVVWACGVLHLHLTLVELAEEATRRDTALSLPELRGLIGPLLVVCVEGLWVELEGAKVVRRVVRR